MKRFWDKVDIKGPNDCWEWMAGCRHGYGGFHVGGKVVVAHRFAYEDKIGPIPNDKLACHSCDNRKCCNPAHLFIGTYRDNAEDAANKGRMHGGPSPYSVKYPEDAAVIRQLVAHGQAQTDVARKFNLSVDTISCIVHR
uniref:Putative homing endonuclease n=1 Tax=viral metagenome TaxID=1070528 RepID=A0A6M3KRH2_9ZZZZ